MSAFLGHREFFKGLAIDKTDYDWGFRTLKVKTARTAKGYAVEGSVSVAELEELGLDLRRFGLGAFRADYDGKEQLVAGACCALMAFVGFAFAGWFDPSLAKNAILPDESKRKDT